MKSFSHVRLFATLWTVAHQAPPSVGFSRQEYWSGVPLPDNNKKEETSLSAMWECSEGAVYKSGRRLLSEPEQAGTMIQTCSFQGCEKIHFCCLNHSFHDIMLLQPKQTRIQTELIWLLLIFGRLFPFVAPLFPSYLTFAHCPGTQKLYVFFFSKKDSSQMAWGVERAP